MINMAFMPLYMWEMLDVTPVTNGRTHEQWKVEQYSVGAESAIMLTLFYVALLLLCMTGIEAEVKRDGDIRTRLRGQNRLLR